MDVRRSREQATWVPRSQLVESAVARADEPGCNADVWLVVRCFNESSIVGAVVRELRATFPNVVGVDDGSTDSSAREMRAAGARIVRHEVNLGAGAALQTGIEFALRDTTARYFVCFDADGQHRVADARAMIERMRAEELDVLIGSRFLTANSVVPAGRRILLHAARAFERLNSGVHLTDAHNGLRVFSRRFAAQLDLTMSDMAYASELARAVARSGMRYAEHPVTIDYTEYSLAKGQRSINSVNIAMDVWISQMLGGRR